MGHDDRYGGPGYPPPPGYGGYGPPGYGYGGPGYGGPSVQAGEVYLLDRPNDRQDVLRCWDLETGIRYNRVEGLVLGVDARLEKRQPLALVLAEARGDLIVLGEVEIN